MSRATIIINEILINRFRVRLSNMSNDVISKLVKDSQGILIKRDKDSVGEFIDLQTRFDINQVKGMSNNIKNIENLKK